MRSTKFIANHMLLILGAIWLLLAAAVLIFQLINPTKITIEWTTATEQNTAGFFLYRSNAPDGEFVQVSKEMVPSEGSAISGATYSYQDVNVVPGETYFYLLEEIEYDATTNRYPEDIISRRVAFVDGWAIILIALATLVGIILVISGLREGD